MRRLIAATAIAASLTSTAPAAEILGGRPAECAKYRVTTHRWCGCWSALDAFGRAVPELFLAINWRRKFPRLPTPVAGAYAVRPGHILKLEAHISGTVWRVLDPNVRNRLVRHERNVRGYTFHLPSGYAAAEARQ